MTQEEFDNAAKAAYSALQLAFGTVDVDFSGDRRMRICDNPARMLPIYDITGRFAIPYDPRTARHLIGIEDQTIIQQNGFDIVESPFYGLFLEYSLQARPHKARFELKPAFLKSALKHMADPAVWGDDFHWFYRWTEEGAPCDVDGLIKEAGELRLKIDRLADQLPDRDEPSPPVTRADLGLPEPPPEMLADLWDAPKSPLPTIAQKPKPSNAPVHITAGESQATRDADQIMVEYDPAKEYPGNNLGIELPDPRFFEAANQNFLRTFLTPDLMHIELRPGMYEFDLPDEYDPLVHWDYGDPVRDLRKARDNMGAIIRGIRMSRNCPLTTVECIGAYRRFRAHLLDLLNDIDDPQVPERII